MVYLDYAATSPVKKEVLDVFNHVCLNYLGNSNSLHSLGIKSKELESILTENISKFFNVKASEIIYTSGATEANNLAIKGICLKYQNRGKHIITTMLEHSSIVAPLNYLATLGFDIDFVNIKDNGKIDLEHLKSLIREDTILVSICAIDSELGLMQPIEKIASLVKNYPKCFFHVDATQAIGKIKLDISNVDLVSLSAHKFYGLKGIGLLIKKEKIIIEPLIHGGKSTTIFRSGTPALPLMASLEKALELVMLNIDEHYEYVKNLNNKIREFLNKYDNVHINSPLNASPYVINFSLKKVKPETFVHALDEKEIYISTKSACSSSDTLSKSVYALTNDDELGSTCLRISLSFLTTDEEIETFFKAFDECYNKLTNLR